MSDPKEHLMEWMRDAHAMEIQALKMMEAQVARLQNYPQLRNRIQQHIEETRGQADRLKMCIERAGGSTSALKDTAGRLTAMMQGLSGLFVGDEVVKGGLASYTFEHMEIASYRILIAAAESVNDDEVRRVCEENLRQEEAMAEWLADHMPTVTKEYLQRDLAEVAAKR